MLEMEPWTAAWILEKLWNMPSGIGSLIGAAMGLFAVAWAARKGFANLITAQEHQADLSRQRDFRLHEEHKQSLAIALRAEIAEIAANSRLRAGRVDRWIEGGPRPTWSDLRFIDMSPSPIFDRVSIHLGDLGRDLSRYVIAVYAAQSEVQGKVDNSRVIGATPMSIETLRNIKEHLLSLADIADEAKRQLAAFIDGSPVTALEDATAETPETPET